VLPLGSQIEPGAVAGYYIDFRGKIQQPSWPPAWFPWPGYHRYMAIAQWGLGAYERYLLAEGEEWLAAAIEAGNYLVAQQQRGGRREGGWLEPREHPHTFRTPVPWLSAMAQGQCASLLVRLHRTTGVESLAEASVKALRPMGLATRAGGVQALLDGRPFPEEYPTDPPSFVLNGALFSLWGYYDVWRGLADDGAGQSFLAGVDTLAQNLHRWDTGFWSRYDLYSHPIVRVCVASPFYHSLHIDQLRAMALIHPRSELERVQSRFEAYAESLWCRGRALACKAAFRLVVPRRPWRTRHSNGIPQSR
jgi:heparosan-N-sulfate-glucuronate 5-epimerase